MNFKNNRKESIVYLDCYIGNESSKSRQWNRISSRQVFSQFENGFVVRNF